MNVEFLPLPEETKEEFWVWGIDSSFFSPEGFHPSPSIGKVAAVGFRYSPTEGILESEEIIHYTDVFFEDDFRMVIEEISMAKKVWEEKKPDLILLDGSLYFPKNSPEKLKEALSDLLSLKPKVLGFSKDSSISIIFKEKIPDVLVGDEVMPKATYTIPMKVHEFFPEDVVVSILKWEFSHVISFPPHLELNEILAKLRAISEFSTHFFYPNVLIEAHNLAKISYHESAHFLAEFMERYSIKRRAMFPFR